MNTDNKLKHNPFATPERYFEKLDKEILKHVHTQTRNYSYEQDEKSIANENKTVSASIISILKPIIGMAAMVGFAMFILNIIFENYIDDSQKLRTIDNITISSNEADLSDSIIHDVDKLLEENVFFDNDFNPSNEEIIEYLIEDIDNFELFCYTYIGYDN